MDFDSRKQGDAASAAMMMLLANLNLKESAAADLNVAPSVAQPLADVQPHLITSTGQIVNSVLGNGVDQAGSSHSMSSLSHASVDSSGALPNLQGNIAGAENASPSSLTAIDGIQSGLGLAGASQAPGGSEGSSANGLLPVGNIPTVGLPDLKAEPSTVSDGLHQGLSTADHALYGEFRDYTYSVYQGVEDHTKAAASTLEGHIDTTTGVDTHPVTSPLYEIHYVDTLSQGPSSITSAVRAAIGDVEHQRLDAVSHLSNTQGL